jgi:hypothetical protein
VVLVFDFDDLFKLFSRYPGALHKAVFIGAFCMGPDIIIRDPSERAGPDLVAGFRAIAAATERLAGSLVEDRQRPSPAWPPSAAASRKIH